MKNFERNKNISEDQNFERGIDPKKAMDIGNEIYRKNNLMFVKLSIIFRGELINHLKTRKSDLSLAEEFTKDLKNYARDLADLGFVLTDYQWRESSRKGYHPDIFEVQIKWKDKEDTERIGNFFFDPEKDNIFKGIYDTIANTHMNLKESQNFERGKDARDVLDIGMKDKVLKVDSVTGFEADIEKRIQKYLKGDKSIKLTVSLLEKGIRVYYTLDYLTNRAQNRTWKYFRFNGKLYNLFPDIKESQNFERGDPLELVNIGIKTQYKTLEKAWDEGGWDDEIPLGISSNLDLPTDEIYLIYHNKKNFNEFFKKMFLMGTALESGGYGDMRLSKDSNMVLFRDNTDSEVWGGIEALKSYIGLEENQSFEIGMRKTIKDWFDSYGIGEERYEIDQDLNIDFETSLDLQDEHIEWIPDNLNVFGSFYLQNSTVKELPDNLKVSGDIHVWNTQIKDVPWSVKRWVGGKVYGDKMTESQNFERGLDVKSSAGIGMESSIMTGLDELKDLGYTKFYITNDKALYQDLLTFSMMIWGSSRDLGQAKIDIKEIFPFLGDYKGVRVGNIRYGLPEEYWEYFRSSLKKFYAKNRIKESQNFERGRDPKETMNIGSEINRAITKITSIVEPYGFNMLPLTGEDLTPILKTYNIDPEEGIDEIRIWENIEGVERKMLSLYQKKGNEPRLLSSSYNDKDHLSTESDVIIKNFYNDLGRNFFMFFDLKPLEMNF